MDASLINYDQARGNQLYATLKDRLRRVPGVQSVAIAATVPFGMMSLGKSITPSDTVVSKEHPALPARYNIVSEDYFQTLEIPLLRGRAFSGSESTSGSKSKVAIIDKLAADKLWPGGDAMGKHIRLDAGGPGGHTRYIGRWRKASGSVRPGSGRRGWAMWLRASWVERWNLTFTFPLGRSTWQTCSSISRLPAGGLQAENQMLESIRREIRATNEEIPLLALKTMRGHMESGIDIWVVRTGARILEIFGSVALLLAVIGLYAVNAYTVSRRTREIGIRMALGADTSSTMGMILGEGP